MAHIQACALPVESLLVGYSGKGGYADCYTTTVQRTVSHAEFVEAFYTGGIFKVERFLLAVFLSMPSTDAGARQLAAGEVDEFSAWRVEGRAIDQLLMRDVSGRTRSWLMVKREVSGAATRLYFGSAVVATRNGSTGQPRLGFPFAPLLGFHKLYSRILLSSATSRLAKSNRHEARETDR